MEVIVFIIRSEYTPKEQAKRSAITMTEWKSITNINLKIPEDKIMVSINNYKSVKETSGIYNIYNHDERLMYVGQSTNLRRRLKDIFLVNAKATL